MGTKHFPLAEEELRKAWGTEGDAIPQQEIDNLVLSFTGTCKAVQKAMGQCV